MLAWVVVAVMKTGGTFTLLDPTYPIERLKRIISTTGCETVLVSKSCDTMFSNSLVVDAQFLGLHGVMGAAVIRLHPLDLDLLSAATAMYVVFTSGSTGGRCFLKLSLIVEKADLDCDQSLKAL